jgi:hypothetical protein
VVDGKGGLIVGVDQVLIEGTHHHGAQHALQSGITDDNKQNNKCELLLAVIQVLIERPEHHQAWHSLQDEHGDIPTSCDLGIQAVQRHWSE